MTNLRLLLLATTALTATQLIAPPSHAQTAPQVMAQAKEEEGKPKQPPKAAPPRPAPPAARPAPPPPRPAAPPPPPPRPAAPPPPPPHPAAPPPPPPHPAAPVAPPPHVPPPAAPPTPPQRPAPPPPPAAAPPPASPKPPAPPSGAPAMQPQQQQQKGAPTPPPPPPPSGRVGPPPAGASAPPPPAGAAAPPPGRPGQSALPPGGQPLARRPPPTVTAPIPQPPREAMTPIAPGAAAQGPRRMEDFRGARQESDQGGRKVFTEPGRVIVVDPSGQSFIRHNEEDRFRFGARDIQTRQVGGETQTIVVRPDGSQIITFVGGDGQLLRRIRRDRDGREIIIIDNSYRDPRDVGGFYVDLPPPVIGIPYDRYIVDAGDAPPDLIYDTMEAPPVERIDRRYSLDEIRYSPSVRALMPSIDLNSINFETGSWEIPPDQAAKLQVIADGLNRAIQRNPREVFLIEGHTDAVGNDVDNLSLSDRRAEAAAELLTQQFNVPPENLTSQGYGSQYLKEQTPGPSAINRRVTIRRITPLLNGGAASLPPPPPGIAPPR
ncbi:MAG TPA: OmpA family protein [Bradyrhizobium sp.]|uniref:OmpA family protein n=1 Tax=Bradyrhizobium sp. TaxID=376 RepID=UPI002C2BB537|nr:OmpA family protein [Bradyrhizobium sp.]HTB02520.1 OmpA family protein [Bradyrhizobium sp.]